MGKSAMQRETGKEFVDSLKMGEDPTEEETQQELKTLQELESDESTETES